jgi:hypothetical protein
MKAFAPTNAPPAIATSAINATAVLVFSIKSDMTFERETASSCSLRACAHIPAAPVEVLLELSRQWAFSGMVARPFRRLPQLVRFVLGNLLTGAAIGWIVAFSAVMTDFRDIGTLLLGSHDLPAGIALLAFGSGAGFGLGYLATALLLMEMD